ARRHFGFRCMEVCWQRRGVPRFSRAGRRREEAAAASIRALAAPIRAVGARLRLIERHELVAILSEYVADAVDRDFLARNGETVARSAAPLAGGVAETPTVDPGIVRGRKRTDRQQRSNQPNKCEPPQSPGRTSAFQSAAYVA